MQRVLLHLLELVVLEQVTEEPVVSLLQTLQVVLKHVVVRIQILDLTQGQLRVQAGVYLVQFEDLQSHLFNVQRTNDVLQLILIQYTSEVLSL